MHAPIRVIPAIASLAVLAAAAGFIEPRQAAQKPQPPAVNRDAQLSAEFVKRVEEYVKLHNKAESKLPKLSDEANPHDIHRHQHALASLIEKARPGAKPGDLFTKETRAYFRRLLNGVFTGPEGQKLKASIMDENPGAIRLRVNGRYPDTVPLSTMPPQVLASLPRLPEHIEYRFIAERLILLDVHAHIVVDYIDEALPK